MSVDITSRDSSAPTTADVRAAAEALKQAIDRHLQAVENRGGEQDEQVQDTYAALHAAAEVYDDLLFEVHDEVTPFSFVSAPVEGPQGGEVDSISIVARRDYDIADGSGCCRPGGPCSPRTRRRPTSSRAWTTRHQPWRCSSTGTSSKASTRAEESGLRSRRRHDVVAPSAQPARGDEDWLDAPFVAVADVDVIYRIDVDPADAEWNPPNPATIMAKRSRHAVIRRP